MSLLYSFVDYLPDDGRANAKTFGRHMVQ